MGKCVMWERFSTSGLAGSYVDELSKAGVKAQMEFRPRRALDPYPFLVSLVDGGEGETFLSWALRNTKDGGDRQADP